ncbi:LysR substrate-binding domain-containing protein [Variovorax sp. GB1P17]|uniref:LysR substrate-binding domain-containing protein n=1 Tax=Variovorax sp. GB1P17 TaxID=3443740 RepID=UPI003F479992
MRIHSPSLPELHAFVAVARTGSLTVAAQHLSVTQGAVSHAIQRLEAHLGLQLFDRHRRGSSLNPAGQAYFDAVAPALDALEAASVRAQGEEDPDLLRIAVIPTFASHWLIRRLPRFHELHPKVRLDFVPYQRERLFTFPNMHATIRGGDGVFPEGVEGAYVAGRLIVPVLRPDEGCIAHPSDFLHRSLLFHTSQPDAWKIWFAALGCPVGKLQLAQGFDQVSQLLEAAAAGLGAAIVQRCLVSDYIDDGRLRIAWDADVLNSRGYYLAHPFHRRLHPPLAKFREWLFHEAQAGEPVGRVRNPLQ